MSNEYMVVDCWGEPAHLFVGDVAHYKLGTERCGKVEAIQAGRALVNGLWFVASDLWME